MIESASKIESGRTIEKPLLIQIVKKHFREAPGAASHSGACRHATSVTIMGDKHRRALAMAYVTSQPIVTVIISVVGERISKSAR
jgi:hypothetical protein